LPKSLSQWKEVPKTYQNSPRHGFIMKTFWIATSRKYRVFGLVLSEEGWMLSFWRWGISSDKWSKVYSVPK
jgi:hypothetical protein